MSSKFILAWNGGSAISGDESPARFVRRYRGTIVPGLPATVAPISLKKNSPTDVVCVAAPAGEFAVVVLDTLAAWLEATSVEAICGADERLGELHQLYEGDWGWSPTIEDRIAPEASWIPNLLFIEKLVIDTGYTGLGTGEVAAELVKRFGTGCSLACVGLDSFDPGVAYSESERARIGQQRLYVLQNCGWRKVPWQHLWVADVLRLHRRQ